MNEEIKDLIEQLNVCSVNDYNFEIYGNDAKILNEYITNLQQGNARLKDKIEKAIELIKHIDKYEETLNDDTRVYMVQDVDVDEIERILKEN